MFLFLFEPFSKHIDLIFYVETFFLYFFFWFSLLHLFFKIKIKTSYETFVGNYQSFASGEHAKS